MKPQQMNAFKNHTNVLAGLLTADQVINSLVSEVIAGTAIIDSLHRFMPTHQLIHAKLDLQARYGEEQKLRRDREREAALAMATTYLAMRPVSNAVSVDLVRRLRTVAGQSTIKPPALDLEAADHIEQLANQVERLAPIEKAGKPPAADAGGPSKQTDLSKRLRDAATADVGLAHAKLLIGAADEIERYYGGMLNWKATAEAKDRATAAFDAAHPTAERGEP